MTSRRLWLHQLKAAGACRDGRKQFKRITWLYTKVRLDNDYIRWASRRVTDNELLWLSHNVLSETAAETYYAYRQKLLKDFRAFVAVCAPSFDDHRVDMFDLTRRFAELYINDVPVLPELAG